MKVWNFHTDFQTVMDTIAYAKNLVLNHLTDQGEADTVDHVEWWIKGDSTFYCPLCMNALSPEGIAADGSPFEALACDAINVRPRYPFPLMPSCSRLSWRRTHERSSH